MERTFFGRRRGKGKYVKGYSSYTEHLIGVAKTTKKLSTCFGKNQDRVQSHLGEPRKVIKLNLV
ncbi:glycerol-3-phosphate dehydrogenase [Sesbania bispinosa]|nr:glycerol-3-phosphate dehydrogenase [Sesbania bispinosa]